MNRLVIFLAISTFIYLGGAAFAQNEATPQTGRPGATYRATKPDMAQSRPVDKRKLDNNKPENNKPGSKRPGHHAGRRQHHHPEPYYDYNYWPETVFCSKRDMRFGGRFRRNKNIDCWTGEYIENGSVYSDRPSATKSGTPTEPETYFSPGPFEYFDDPRF